MSKLISGRKPQTVYCAPGEGVTVRNPLTGSMTFKVRGEQSGGTLFVLEPTVSPGDGPMLHVHNLADEAIYVLDGTFRFKVDGEIRDAPAGTFAFIPRGVPHTWQNVGNRPARLLGIVLPAGLERFFESYAELPEDQKGPEAFRRLGSEHDAVVLGPPLAESDPL